MTLRTRKKLFFTFAFLFIVCSIGVVCYTQGYRLDIQSGSVTRTGSLYIESYNSPITIYLNDKAYEDKSGILKKGTLISGILPKKYTVRIEKEGFVPYIKNIEVAPLQVVRLFHTLLVPEHTEPSSILTSTGTTALLSTAPSGTVLAAGDKKSYIILESSPATPVISLTSYLASLTKNSYENLRFSPDESGRILATRNNTWYAIDMQSDTIEQTDIPQYAQTFASETYLFGIGAPLSTSTRQATRQATATTTRISVYDFSGGGLTDSFDAPFPADMLAAADGKDRTYAFLLANGDVWLRQNGVFEKIAHDAKRILFSPDSYKLLLQDTNGALFALLLRDEFETLDAPRGTAIRLYVADARSITAIQWHADSYHVFLGYPDRITLEELTYIRPDNQPVIRTGAYMSFLYNKATNTLFVLAQKGIIEKITLDWK